MDNRIRLNELSEIKNNIELTLDKIDKLYKKELEKLDEIEREDPSDEWWAMWDETEENIRSSVDTKGYYVKWQHSPDCITPPLNTYYFGQQDMEWCHDDKQVYSTNYLDLNDEIIKLQIKQLQKESK